MHYLAKYLPPPSIRPIFLKYLVGNSATNNYLRIIFELILSTDSPNTCRMSWRIIKCTIVTWIINICETYCPPSRSKIIVKFQRPKSIGLQTRKRHPILTGINPLGFWVRRGLGLVSFLTANSKEKILPSITLHSAIASFASRQECLSKIICRIAMRTVLASVPDNIPSEMDWWEP